MRCSCLHENWLYLHFSSLNRVMMPFPIIPVDSISIWWMCAMVINTIQVGAVTGFVPPGSLKVDSTTAGIAVIILIFGWKRATTMPRQRVTSISWQENKIVRQLVPVNVMLTKGRAMLSEVWRQSAEHSETHCKMVQKLLFVLLTCSKNALYISAKWSECIFIDVFSSVVCQK